jgi:D-tyrosyl-tRNA(Tyr) deacylase
MRVLAQRVREASVTVDGGVVSRIGAGMLLLVGIAADDSPDDGEWLAQKLAHLRIFDDEAGVMNRSVIDTCSALLAVPQFTLYASTRKGNRPSWSRAAPPDLAQPRFDAFVRTLATRIGRPVPTGVFGANMQVALVNDGPVTLWLDSRSRE